MTDLARDGRIRDTVDHICQRWVDADRVLLRYIFPLLARGQPLSASQIAEATGTSTAVIETALVAGRVGRDMEGRVTELFGVMLDPTMHRVEVGGVCLFTCCAAIAQMVPALVGQRAVIESVDPVSRRVVKLTLGPAGDLHWDPPEAVACFVETELDEVMRNVCSAFCSHVHHFASPDSAGQFVASDPRRYILEMPDFHAVSVRLRQRIWA